MNARDEFRNLLLSMKMLEGGFTEGDGISEMSYKSSIYLDLIALGGEMNVSSLAGIMRVSPSAVTRRLNILEDLGLVVRGGARATPGSRPCPSRSAGRRS